VIVGIGVDIVDIGRIGEVIERHGTHFLKRAFTDAEIAYCRGHKNPAPHFAARFAAKEAVFKAFGTGWRGGLAWNEIEVSRDSLGRPRIRLTGKCAAKARELGITELLITLSHCDCHAVAYAVGQGEETRRRGDAGMRGM
jgi:holo-[acyl-carrier protein] synthase